jgi:hypothetical protein
MSGLGIGLKGRTWPKWREFVFKAFDIGGNLHSWASKEPLVAKISRTDYDTVCFMIPGLRKVLGDEPIRCCGTHIGELGILYCS